MRTTVPLVMIWLASVISPNLFGQNNQTEGGAGSQSHTIFEQRILPILKSANPSSCIQCHLASVDLKNYILPTAEKTFQSLRDQGLINLDNPTDSKVLQLIKMGEQDLDRGAKLIHAKTRQAEFQAFAEWIQSCCKEQKYRDLPPLSAMDVAKPAKPLAVIRHNRKDRVLDSFVRNVWSQRMRCYPCHTPFELDGQAEHSKPKETHRKFEEQIGQRMNIFRQSPAETMRHLITSSRKSAPDQLPLINTKEPRLSLLVLKPTAKVPGKDANGQPIPASNSLPVSHGGGLKMFVDDQSYKAFMAWIEDYARVVDDHYETARDLPLDNWIPTKYVIRMSDVPANWKETNAVQIFLYGWDPNRSTWNSKPSAFTQGRLTPRRFVNGSLFLFGPASHNSNNESEKSLLPAGKYLVKVFVDQQQRLSSDATLLLSSEDFFGQTEIEAQWREGFQLAEIFSADRLSK